MCFGQKNAVFYGFWPFWPQNSPKTPKSPISQFLFLFAFSKIRNKLRNIYFGVCFWFLKKQIKIKIVILEISGFLDCFEVKMAKNRKKQRFFAQNTFFRIFLMIISVFYSNVQRHKFKKFENNEKNS